ncbi:MAG: hypothetical protein ACLR23_05225 [Clostridia bacterium]
MHKETKSPPAEGRWAKRVTAERKCTPEMGGKVEASVQRRQNPRRQHRDGQAGGEMERKMHAGESRKGRGERAHGGNCPPASSKRPKPAEKWEEKCTLARRGTAGTSVHTPVNFSPASSKQAKLAEKQHEKCTPVMGKRWRPACTKRQNPRRQRRDGQSGVTAV